MDTRRPILSTFVRALLTAAVVPVLAAGPGLAADPTAKNFDVPDRTGWRPEGCRSVPAESDVIGSRGRWRLLHSDIAASDEVSIALAPVFEADWHAEPDTFHVTVPVFDADGNLYVIPYLPHDDVALVSLDPDDGSRRWAIAGTGAPTGACAPISLDDPDNPGEEILYVTLKDRAFAVRPDGTMVWDVPTGLTLSGFNPRDATSGNSYLPQRDAIVGLTTGGQLYLLDRETGAQILDEPFEMPGEPSPAGEGLTLPPALVEAAEADLGRFISFPDESSFETLLAAILGNDIEVSNSFAIDAHSGRLWIAATAPDAADGTVDGTSELGALYGLDIVDGVGGPEVEVACRKDFVGGSASTPGVRSDGTRIYVADNDGNVIAVDSECAEVWRISLGSQVTGSIAVASDNDEIYASTQQDIVQIFDGGSSGIVGWTANLDVYNLGAPGRDNFSTLLASVAANGIGFMAGVGIAPGDLANIGLPIRVGYGVLDRDTGSVRYFADGLDESVAELDAGPDGAYYNANSPIRRAFTRALLGSQVPEIEGGVRKFAPRRVDLLVRDAVCAAADRAENAEAVAMSCADSAEADGVQIADLLAQVERMGPVAAARGDLTTAKWDRVSDLVVEAGAATLVDQATVLPRACAVLAPCDPAPRSGCLAAGSSKVTLKRKADASPNVDRLTWKWSRGEAFGDAEIGDPAMDADYGLCAYVDADASPRLVYDSGIPASASSWSLRPGSASWSGKSGTERGLSKLGVKGGDAGRTSISAKASGATFPRGTLPVAAPLLLQLVNSETGECWSSRFEAGDVIHSDATTLKAKN